MDNNEPRLPTPRVVIRTPRGSLTSGASALRDWVARVEMTPIEGVFTGDHISFHNGSGYEGLIEATAVVAASQRLTVWTAVYLLALRHPVPVARAISSLAAVAKDRFVFGVGLGGEDPHELEICGVDPHTRGRRLDSHLAVVRSLMAGETVSVHDEFVDIPEATIRPVPNPPVPVLVGGRSDAALRRVARDADGWIAIWTSVERARAALATIADHAAACGRTQIPNRNALMVWCGFGPSRQHAQSLVAPVMEDLYKIPFTRFEQYTPCGTPEDVAEAIAPYLELGFDDVLLNGVADDPSNLIKLSAEVATILGAP
ncbi:LLM class flavin-dependent oxidoreductase [Mycobacterium sp. CVI_P3]|uniref:LLM class flavin-dependent oxidoreductase n=1 Tax=Mycobacterium pinniadriaticum TaxID=2994102 RepID=A0ABT3SDC2_9MYCO|nr:LLM class flavin-dependent oxidoreductase [Mycobacterium pinniadriaticum]MCX2931270.1 LLM class flavin-dependent oxidoreductase [Mycobacterium pinniadriaticum]MCX2937506.1 LLM class flavin-dependent oxidoreductase [Mycobacterium pinniadriaticum]